MPRPKKTMEAPPGGFFSTIDKSGPYKSMAAVKSHDRSITGKSGNTGKRTGKKAHRAASTSIPISQPVTALTGLKSIHTQVKQAIKTAEDRLTELNTETSELTRELSELRSRFETPQRAPMTHAAGGGFQQS